MNRSHLFSICSNDGWNRIDWSCEKVIACGIERTIFGKMRIIGSFWDRAEAETGPIKSASREDFLVDLFQVRIEVAALKQLNDELGATTPSLTPMQFLLSKGDPELRIALAKRDDFLSSAGSLTFSAVFQTQRMKAEWAFNVDQTNVAAMLGEIQVAQRQFQP